MPFVTVRDLRLYYEIRGAGPRLLCISGTGGDLRRSPNIFEMPFARHFETLGYDQRGLGQTSRPDIPYTMADYAEDANTLLDAVGWEGCKVLGISFGGMVAQEFALRYPQRVERLVLACTSSGGQGGASYPLHELAHLPPGDYVRHLLFLSDTRRDNAWRAANPAQFQALFDQTLAALRIGADEPGRQIGARRQLEARAHHDTCERLPSLRMPVYICEGRYDGIAPPAILEAMQKQIPGARLELFDGGHLFFLQDARAFERIGAFLQGDSVAEQDLSKVEGLYDRIAKEYAETFKDEHAKKPKDQEILRRFAREIGDRRPVWDFGCGPGQTSGYLNSLGLEISGLDLSEKILEQARRLQPGIPFRQGNMLSLEFENDSIAGVVAFYAILHSAEQQVAMVFREVFRVLKPGGLFLLTFHIGDKTLHLTEFLGHDVDIDFMFFTSDFIALCLKEIGFARIEIIEREPYPTVEYQSRRAYVFATKPEVELERRHRQGYQTSSI
jgi:3-oxoadipate enol-lactonase